MHCRFLPILFCLSLAAHGTVVTTFQDEDNGSLVGGAGISLREAVKYSAVGDTITFAPALSGKTIRLTLGQITIANSLTIDGSALTTRITLSGDKTGNGKTSDDTNVLVISAGTVVLDSLIVSGGNKIQGSGIIVTSVAVNITVDSCQFVGNFAQNAGGAIYFAVNSGSGTPVLSIRDSTFTGNSAGYDGGAIYALFPVQILRSTFTGNAAAGGGAIYYRPPGSAPTSTFQDTVFTGNSSTAYGGAIYLFAGSILLERSTVAGNSALVDGGGIYTRGNAILLDGTTVSGNIATRSGGGIFAYNGYVDLKNSTIAMNTANSHGGGIFFRNTIDALNCTIAANSAGISGGGLAEGTAYLQSCIVSGNNAPSSPDILLREVDVEGNLITPILSLAPLGNHGGPTQTMPPLPGSPAIDPEYGPSWLYVDQRGHGRVNQRDLGAVEYQGDWSDDASIIYQILPLIWSLDADGDGFPYAMERFHGTNPFHPDASDSANLSSPAINAEGHPFLTFSVARETAIPDTHAIWTLQRSPDLTPGSFHAIYYYGSLGESAAPGVTFERSPGPSDDQKDRVTVTDTTLSTGRAFYRFQAVLQPE